jgi:hypothetical protein
MGSLRGSLRNDPPDRDGEGSPIRQETTVLAAYASATLRAAPNVLIRPP